MVPTVECPYCQAELQLADEDGQRVCEGCGHPLNPRVQLIFARGREDYLNGQGIGTAISGRKRKLRLEPQEIEMLRCFQRAYSSLQEAFHFDLPASQRESGIEMMADITHVLNQREMISPLEARYWTTLMVEVTARREYDSLGRRLSDSRPHAAPGPLRRVRWHLRRWQLRRALGRLDEQIRRLEEYIGFADPPCTRRRG